MGKTVAERIREARVALDLSQDDLAAAVGVSRPAVSQWEAGTASPKIDKIRPLVKALGITTHWLLDEDAPAGVAKLMPVHGEVAAGTWKEAVDLDLSPIPVTPSPAYPAESQYGLLVRGTSLNRVALDGEYLIVVDVLDGGLRPVPGDLVIAQKRRHGLTEATAKRLVRENGRQVLKPESDDPRHQETVEPGAVDNETEIVISAIVIGKYTPIPRGPR